MTAREYLLRYEPGVLDLMMDPDTALADDTRKASLIARSLGTCGRFGAYPLPVWRILYAD